MEKLKSGKFKVLLHRSYVVEVVASNETDARRFAEFFIGNPSDESQENERKEMKFSIGEMEMVYNEANEIVLDNE
ncbi:MAG TPA: hypothetical protein PL009_01865 [Flavipsychrobacter sp.]|nr:hypothetical protein [Flavipsychrobacter sp.]